MSATCESELVIEAVRPTGEGWKQRNWLAGSVYIRPRVSKVTAGCRNSEEINERQYFVLYSLLSKPARLFKLHWDSFLSEYSIFSVFQDSLRDLMNIYSQSHVSGWGTLIGREGRDRALIGRDLYRTEIFSWRCYTSSLLCQKEPLRGKQNTP